MKAMRGLRYLPEEATVSEMDSPVGQLTIITSSQGLHAILWESDVVNLAALQAFKKTHTEKTILETKKQLRDYFQGCRKRFDLPLVLNGTDFQLQAWQQLRNIPYGKTISYGEQAANMGDKNKARAVGMANGVNPISIIVPCHRVIGSNGHLTGFGGGLDKKAILLKLEAENNN